MSGSPSLDRMTLGVAILAVADDTYTPSWLNPAAASGWSPTPSQLRSLGLAAVDEIDSAAEIDISGDLSQLEDLAFNTPQSPTDRLAGLLHDTFQELLTRAVDATQAKALVNQAFDAYATDAATDNKIANDFLPPPPDVSLPWWVYAGGVLFGLWMTRDILREV